MKPTDIATLITGSLAFMILIKEILKDSGGQSCASWMLWLILDAIILRGIIAKNGEAALYWVFISGTSIVVLLLIIKKKFSWGLFESAVALLVGICIYVYYQSGPVTAIKITAAALDIAGIMQLIKTYKHPKEVPTFVYILFTAAGVFSVIGADAWTVPDRLPAMNSLAFNLIIALLSMRKAKQ